jgi:hypothetical protein
MTGRYLIFTPLDSKPKMFRGEDPKFRRNWSKFIALCESLHRDGLTYTVEFNLGHIGPHVIVKASGRVKPRRQPSMRGVTPPPVPAQRCHNRALEAAWFLPENREHRNSKTPYWILRRNRHDELSQMAEEQLRAEYEYWRELELLSGQRQRFKPGLTDETFHVDDEVKAVAA